MDHEFSTALLEPGIAGWDWFSLQFDDQTEIMVFLLRTKKQTLHAASSGTFVNAAGQTRKLGKNDFKIDVLDTWKSRHSQARYPSCWRLLIGPLAIDVTIKPKLSDQEMRTPGSTGVTYWEGSVSVEGNKEGRPVKGQGYVELTGYAGAFDAPL
jgi:predicted secreted hydrolase